MKPKITISSQILKISIAGVGIFLILTSLTAFKIIEQWLLDGFDNNLLTKARVLITLFEKDEDGFEFEFADEIMPEFSRTESPEYFQFWHQNGDNFEKSESLFDSELPYAEELVLNHRFEDIILPNGHRGRMVQIGFTPHLDDDFIAGDNLSSTENLVLVLAREKISLETLLRTIAIVFFLTIPSILLIIASIIRFAVIRGLKPLDEVNTQLSEINGHDLSKRIVIQSPAVDLEGVVSVLNQVLDRIQQSFQREQRFSSDVAHELKTPIAELMNMAEVAAKWPLKVNHEEFYIDALNSSKKLQLIVDSLLEMARCKTGGMQFAFTNIDLQCQINSILLKYEQSALEKDIVFDNNMKEDLQINTSELVLDMILSNLLSNAVEYSAVDSHIEIDQWLESDKVTLSISNQVRNLEIEDLPHMTESLWRKDQSRSSDNHIGLGLTLVQAYCEILELEMDIRLELKRLTVSISGFSPVKKHM